MLKRTKKGHKEEDTWKGPYKVVSITKYGCCNLECPTTGRVIKQKVDIRQLKRYQQQLTDSVQPLPSFSSEEVCEGFVQIPEEIIEENKRTDDPTSSDDMLHVLCRWASDLKDQFDNVGRAALEVYVQASHQCTPFV